MKKTAYIPDHIVPFQTKLPPSHAAPARALLRQAGLTTPALRASRLAAADTPAFCAQPTDTLTSASDWRSDAAAGPMVKPPPC